MRVLIFLVFSLLSSGAEAQNERPPLDAALVPARGRAAKDFVPRGWRIEEQAGGDLNGDRAPDTVLRLVEDLPAETDGVRNERQRALVVLFGEPGGGLRRAGVGTRLLLCTLCAGVLGDPYGANIVIEVARGVLSVSQLSGSREATNVTHRFRYDARAGRFALIGEDVETTDRATGDRREESTNYLTGVKIRRAYKAGRDGVDHALVSNKRERVAAPRRFLEEVSYGR